MQLQTVRPNIVQAIRAYRVDDLMKAAEDASQHFLYANLGGAQSKQEVLERIAEAFLFPAHYGKNLDALYDCMTDLVHKAGVQPGFVVVLDQLPDNPRFDREAREQLLDVFRDAADFWAERRIAFRCFYSFSVPRSSEAAPGERAEPAQAAVEKPAPKAPVSKNGFNPNIGVNMPLMSSALDTTMWLTAPRASPHRVWLRPARPCESREPGAAWRVSVHRLTPDGGDHRREPGSRQAAARALSGVMTVRQPAPSCCASATYSPTGTSCARRCRSNPPSAPRAASQRPSECRSSLRRCEKAAATNSPSSA